MTPKFVSPSDPAAQWTGALRGPAFFAYANNYLIDTRQRDHRRCRSDPRHPPGRGRSGAHHDRSRDRDRFGLKPERLAADSAYGAAPMLAWLVKDKAIAPHIPVFDRSRRDDGTLSRADFTFDASSDVYVCPQGKMLSNHRPGS